MLVSFLKLLERIMRRKVQTVYTPSAGIRAALLNCLNKDLPLKPEVKCTSFRLGIELEGERR